MATFILQSSYGQVINLGSSDPFNYGKQPRLPRILQSEDDCSTSMSMSVDDTFSFICCSPRDSVRKWVDSDASSFYFRPPSQSHSHMIQPYNRAHRQQDSALSVSSVAPPISLHNCSFTVHQRNDSNTSASSMAFSHAMHGANSGWAAWAKHRRDSSMDSVTSDFSARCLGRPGVGDKIFKSAPDYGMPLTSISALPPESVTGKLQGNGTSYDSILDGEGEDLQQNMRTAAHLLTLSSTKPATSLQFHWRLCLDMTSCPISKEICYHPISSGLSPHIAILLITAHTMRMIP